MKKKKKKKKYIYMYIYIYIYLFIYLLTRNIVCVWACACVYVSVSMRMCVRDGHSESAKWILKKPHRHDPLVPDEVSDQKYSESDISGRGKKKEI